MYFKFTPLFGQNRLKLDHPRSLPPLIMMIMMNMMNMMNKIDVRIQGISEIHHVDENK